MPPPLPKSVTRSKRPTRLLLVLIVLPVLCISALVWARLRLRSEYKGRLHAIHAANLPISGAEMNAWLPDIRNEQNGALLMSDAFALFKTFPDQRSNIVADGKITTTNVWSSEVRALVHEYLQTNQAALTTLSNALRYKEFRYPVDYSPGFDTLLPHLPQVKKTAQTLSLRTTLAAAEQRTNDWPDSLHEELRVSETLNCEGTFISYLVRVASLQVAVNTAERSLNHSLPTAEKCEELQRAFTRLTETNLLPLAFICERAMVMPIFNMDWQRFQKLANSEGNEESMFEALRGANKPGPIFHAIGFFERDLNFYLKTMDEAITLAASPAPEYLELTNHIEAAHQLARKRYYILSSMMLPSLGKVALKHATTDAKLRLAATAFAIERFRHTHGKLPSALKELSPEFLSADPIDPFDGKHLRFVPLERGYSLYSIGDDGNDDNGRDRPSASRKLNDTNTYDLTFTVNR